MNIRKISLAGTAMIFILAACAPLQYEPGQTTKPAAAPTDTGGAPTATSAQSLTYSDPGDQYSFSLPAGWQAGDEPGLFTGQGAYLRTGYLPDHGSEEDVTRVCEWQANTPQGPGRQINFPYGDLEACLLTPYPEMSTNVVTLIVKNPSGAPAQRYLYLEGTQEAVDAAYASLKLVNGTASVPTGTVPAVSLDPDWAAAVPWSSELSISTYPLGDTLQRPADDVLAKEAGLRDQTLQERFAAANPLLAPFGYNLHDEQLDQDGAKILDQVQQVWPVSVSADGSNFVMQVEALKQGDFLLQKDGLAPVDINVSTSTTPVYVGSSLVSEAWDGTRSEVDLFKDGKKAFSFAALYMVAPPTKGLWSWNGSWLLEIDGFLIQDGQNLNQTLDFDEIFGWQVLNDQPFYFYRQDEKYGFSFAGQNFLLPFTAIPHYACCEDGMYNPAGNDDIAWFYGQYGGQWYYVEMGKFAGEK